MMTLLTVTSSEAPLWNYLHKKQPNKRTIRISVLLYRDYSFIFNETPATVLKGFKSINDACHTWKKGIQ